MNLTIQELKSRGYSVAVRHLRYPVSSRVKMDFNLYPQSKMTVHPSPRGGQTEVSLMSPDGKKAFGVARCNLVDNFNRRLGVRKALGRAWSNIQNNILI